MEYLNGILDMLKACLWIGVIIVCTVLIISGILRWLAPQNMRNKRLNIAGWIAFAVLAVMFLYNRRGDIIGLFSDSTGNRTMTTVVINMAKMSFKFLLLGAVLAIVAIMLLVFIVIFKKGIHAALFTHNQTLKEWARSLNATSNDFRSIIKTPIFTFLVTCGIILVFILLPFLMGNSEPPKSTSDSASIDTSSSTLSNANDTKGLAATWVDGVVQFANAVKNKSDSANPELENNGEGGELNESEKQDIDTKPEESNKGTDSAKEVNNSKPVQITVPVAVIEYTLMFLIVLGVGFAIIRILFAIVKDNLRRKNATNLVEEYSSSMGILGVGVSILLVLQNKEFSIHDNSLVDAIGAFFKYFVIVAAVLTLAITILEVISLIINTRITLIQQEARYLYVAFVGNISLLILTTMNSLFSILNSILGHHIWEGKIDQIQQRLADCIMQTMDGEIDQKSTNADVTFTVFNEKVTKK